MKKNGLGSVPLSCITIRSFLLSRPLAAVLRWPMPLHHSTALSPLLHSSVLIGSDHPYGICRDTERTGRLGQDQNPGRGERISRCGGWYTRVGKLGSASLGSISCYISPLLSRHRAEVTVWGRYLGNVTGTGDTYHTIRRRVLDPLRAFTRRLAGITPRPVPPATGRGVPRRALDVL